eukprot:jgi/Chlat1/4040/Chrsp26S03998
MVAKVASAAALPPVRVGSDQSYYKEQCERQSVYLRQLKTCMQQFQEARDHRQGVEEKTRAVEDRARLLEDRLERRHQILESLLWNGATSPKLDRETLAAAQDSSPKTSPSATRLKDLPIRDAAVPLISTSPKGGACTSPKDAASAKDTNRCLMCAATRRQHAVEVAFLKQKMATIERNMCQSNARLADCQEELSAEKEILLDSMQQNEALQAKLAQSQRQLTTSKLELQRSRRACLEAEGGRRAARVALLECAAQNTRLVEAFADKKREVRRLTGELKRQSALKDAHIEDIEHRLRVADAEVAALRQQLAETSQLPAVQRQDAYKQDDLAVGITSEGPCSFDYNTAQSPTGSLQSAKAVFTSCASSSKCTSPCSVPFDLGDDESAEIPGADIPVMGAISLHCKARNTADYDIGARDSELDRLQSEVALLQSENLRLNQLHQDALAQVQEAMHFKEANKLKIKGNGLFNQGQYEQACKEYSAALALQLTDGEFNAVVYCNRGAAHAAVSQYLSALADCNAAIRLSPAYTRAIQRRAEVFIAIGDYSSALQDLTQLGSSAAKDTLTLSMTELKRRVRRKAAPNYYAVLSLSDSASHAEVKAAYRKLALRHHPDKAPFDAVKCDAEALFKRLGEAYAVLCDAQKRQKYDLENGRFAHGLFGQSREYSDWP